MVVSACSDSESPNTNSDGDDTQSDTDNATEEPDAGAARGPDGGRSSIDASTPPKNDAALGGDASTTAHTDAAVTGQHADASATTDPARPKPKCVQKDSQVIVIGDSYINWPSHTFPQDIVNASGQNWRMEAVGGFSMASGGIGSIPSEYDLSIAADPDAHTVLMDGGGNDILLPDPTLDLLGTCKETGSSMNANCQKIIKMAIDTAGDLMDRMASAGIRDVVYFFYPEIPEGRPIGGGHPNEILHYALPMVKDFCDGAEKRTSGKLRCTFIDMIPVFAGHNPDWFNTDIHPNSMGSQAMAKAIWQVMSDKCIAQKGAKDCCEQ